MYPEFYFICFFTFFYTFAQEVFLNPYQKNVLSCINCSNVKTFQQLLKQLQNGCTRDFLAVLYITKITTKDSNRHVLLRTSTLAISEVHTIYTITSMRRRDQALKAKLGRHTYCLWQRD